MPYLPRPHPPGIAFAGAFSMPSMPLPTSRSLGAHVADVRSLLSTLAARREKTNADHQLARRVFVAFERLGQVDVRGLHFYVFDGAISVYGAVASSELRDDVLGALAALPGVRHITEHLQVAAPHKPRRAFSIRPVVFDSL